MGKCGKEKPSSFKQILFSILNWDVSAFLAQSGENLLNRKY